MRSEHTVHFGDETTHAHAAHLGMWVFLASEVLLFTGLFTAYVLYRFDYPEVFAQGHHHMELALGTANTYVLVTSSVLVALAVSAARAGSRLRTTVLLGLALCLGATFLGIKAVEYSKHIAEGGLPGARYHLESFQAPGASLFFSLYWVMTGIHALHVAVGIGVLFSLAVLSARGRFTAASHVPLEVGGMYWHLVDVIWLFLWPLLYLA